MNRVTSELCVVCTLTTVPNTCWVGVSALQHGLVLSYPLGHTYLNVTPLRHRYPWRRQIHLWYDIHTWLYLTDVAYFRPSVQLLMKAFYLNTCFVMFLSIIIMSICVWLKETICGHPPQKSLVVSYYLVIKTWHFPLEVGLIQCCKQPGCMLGW